MAMRILVSYRGAPRIRGWETGAMVAEAFRRLGHEVHEYARIYETQDWVQNGTLPESYDLILNMECNDPEPQYFELTKIGAKKRAVWHFDTSYYVDQALTHISQYAPDHVFFANSKFREFGWDNTSWLPYAADPRFIRPLSHEKTIDVGLVGSDRPERRTLIDFLEKHGIKAQLISGVFTDDYIDALASCRIVINENPKQGKGLLNMRTFEAPAAGALLLSGDIDHIGEVLSPLESAAYGHMVGAVHACEALLSDPVALIKKSQRGQRRIESDHMYDHRAQEILDVLF